MEYSTPSETEKHRENDGKANAENDLTHHRKHGGGACLSHSLQKNKGRFVYTGKNNEHKVCSERLDCEFCIVGALICGTENIDNGFREKFDNDKSKRTCLPPRRSEVL